MQLIFAALVAIAVAWFVDTAWFPTVRSAIRQLPSQGEIRLGTLVWTGPPALLAEGHFLAFVVDPDHRAGIRSPAHIQVEFGATGVRVFSLFGYSDWAYPGQWIIQFNQTELRPWWGAWETPILWLTVVAVIAGLIGLWALVAALYAPAVWIGGFFANRDLNLLRSWKLAGAALMPGTLVLIAGIFFHGLGVLDMLQFLAAACAHVVTGWIYSAISPCFAPRLALLPPAGGNPFSPGGAR